jgi:dihydrofolate reductase
VKLALIAAIGRNRGIGRDGKLPWHISEDLKRFKQLTTGHAVLMGRKTFESLGRSLPNRRNVVLSSHPIPGVETYGSIPEALQALAGLDTVFVIGGGHVYAALLERADRLHLTLVDREVEADTFFPPYEHLLGLQFRLTNAEDHSGFAFVDYERISPR